jgi:hypothetical protein
MLSMLTAVINGHVVRVTEDEWDALRRDGATDEIVRRIQARLTKEN